MNRRTKNMIHRRISYSVVQFEELGVMILHESWIVNDHEAIIYPLPEEPEMRSAWILKRRANKGGEIHQFTRILMTFYDYKEAEMFVQQAVPKELLKKVEKK